MPGFSRLPAERVVLAGIRDLEPGERRAARRVRGLELGPGEAGGLEATLPAAGRVSLHVDLDVLDPAYGRANRVGGARPDSARMTCSTAVRAVASRSQPAAVTLSAYDPAFDATGSVRQAALAVLRRLA